MSPARPPIHLATALRAAYCQHDPHRRAAVELLIWHEHWLRRRDFLDAAVLVDDDEYGGQVWISFSRAREAFEAGQFDRCSSSERAVLDLAIALGEDRYRLAYMGAAHSAAIARAMCAAVGLDSVVVDVDA